jgi:transposase-like protein
VRPLDSPAPSSRTHPSAEHRYVKVGGAWRYVYRAVDQQGQAIDVLVPARRDSQAARRFFAQALATLKVTRGRHRRRTGLPAGP